ncbi:MAG: ABC transporter substrate-binding protein [Moraxellaceae bacterium]|nr:ABC transporter substrate-binding protein [Moraxellaceae bacterium]MDZ4298966.1 ABC transporter substrate-binding protein [Moraxellaceae bacterium]MDZ4388036.1 ABC transporter substrate-binding protein [Moraxellaceae bacterium]
MNRFIASFLGFFMLLATSLTAYADASNPRDVVQTAVVSITERLKKDQQALKKNPAALEKLIEEGIEPFVDVPGIARGVMGQFFRQATPEQRERFVQVFRNSMIRTYANGLGSYNNQKIVVKPYRPGDDPSRAQVDIDVTLDGGQVVPVVFQMVKTPQGEWKARNILVNGLNLGLAFRQRFAQTVEQNRGSIERAINAWSPEGIDPIGTAE